jgi:hypothetical protein
MVVAGGTRARLGRVPVQGGSGLVTFAANAFLDDG